MKNAFAIIVLSVLIIACSDQKDLCEQNDSEEILACIAAQLNHFYSFHENYYDPVMIPVYFNENGLVRWSSLEHWSSSYYSGVLWMIYDLSGSAIWSERASQLTNQLMIARSTSEADNDEFMNTPAYADAYRITGDNKYREKLILTARNTIRRFNEKAGCLGVEIEARSESIFEVSMEEMMNLELLFWAAQETGERVFYNIACRHAQTTLQNQFSTNFFPLDVLYYNYTTKEIVDATVSHSKNKIFNANACALYGFVISYRETHNTLFLRQAENIAANIIAELKITNETGDNLQDTGQYYNLATLAIIVSAMFQLSQFSANKSQQIQFADHLLLNFPIIEFQLQKIDLNESVSVKSSITIENDICINEACMCAYYYFLEALERKIEIQKSLNTVVKSKI